jgi:hypothetical protein
MLNAFWIGLIRYKLEQVFNLKKCLCVFVVEKVGKNRLMSNHQAVFLLGRFSLQAEHSLLAFRYFLQIKNYDVPPLKMRVFLDQNSPNGFR